MIEKKYRDNGAIGALLDEYEKAILELKNIISPLSKLELTEIIDHKTKDEDCRSIQSILSHVIESGYNYAIVIRKSLGEEIEYVPKVKKDSTKEYQLSLDKMFEYNLNLFSDYPKIKLEEYNDDKKIKVRNMLLFIF